MVIIEIVVDVEDVRSSPSTLFSTSVLFNRKSSKTTHIEDTPKATNVFIKMQNRTNKQGNSNLNRVTLYLQMVASLSG